MTTDLPEPSAAKPAPGQLTFSAPRRGKPPRHLADLTPAERKEAVVALGHPGFRAKQLSTHYFERLVESPEDMTDLPKAVRDDLVRDLLPPLLTPHVQRTADDGMTIKSAWRLHDGAIVESVLMRYPRRVTICISSQAGCGMNCPFCATGQAGLTRNMSTGEIVEQVVAAARMLRRGELGAAPPAGRAADADADAPDRHGGARRRGRPGRADRPDPHLQRRVHGHGRGTGQLQGRGRRPSAASPTPHPTGWACLPAGSPCRPSGWSRPSTSWRARASR